MPASSTTPKSLLAFARTLAVACLVSQAHAAAPVQSEEPVLLQGLLPGGRGAVAAASNADALPDSADLARARSLYAKWFGAWLPQHAKPTPDDRGEVQAFTAALQARLPALSEQEHLGRASVDEPTFLRILVIGSPAFLAARQTPGTQSLKALAIMGLVEHELDIQGGAAIAFSLLPALSQRTPLDADVEMFYARLALDSKMHPAAWRAVRTGLLLRGAPSDGDLDFACFVGSVVAKAQWPEIQAMVRTVASSEPQSDAAIARCAILFGERAGSSWIPRGGTIRASAPAH